MSTDQFDSSTSGSPRDPSCTPSPDLHVIATPPSDDDPAIVGAHNSKGSSAGEEASDNDPTCGTGSSESDDVQVPRLFSAADKKGSKASKAKDGSVKRGVPGKSVSSWMGVGRRSSGASDIVSSVGEERALQKQMKDRRSMASSVSKEQTATGKDTSAEWELAAAVVDPANDTHEIVGTSLTGSLSRTQPRSKLSRSSSTEIQPGAVRVRGVNRQDVDESSSKFDDDPTILVQAGHEPWTGIDSSLGGAGNTGSSASLVPLDEIESGTFTASTSATTIGSGREILRDSTTAVTATAVTQDDLEQEVRDRIRREAVVAHVADDVPESAPEGSVKRKILHRKGLVVGLIFVVASVIVGVTLAVVLQGSNSSSTINSPTAAPSDTNQTSPRLWTPEQLKEFVIGELGTSKGFTLPGFTPAKASYDLILGGDVFDNVTLGTRLMDAFVILALWAGTGGQNGWTRSDGWNQNPYPCTWYGISCNEEGRVAKIMVPGNNLNGPLNPDLHYLANHLTHLDVSNNHVGLFKFNLTSLPSLQHLNFSNNPNNGFTIEGSIHYNLTNLEVLDFSSCVLGGAISADVARLSNLRTLHLQDNSLTGPIPSEIASLTGLTSLRLEKNELSGSIPVEICSRDAGALGTNVSVSVDCDSVNCSCCVCESSSR